MQYLLVSFLSLFSASAQAEILTFKDDRGMVFTRDSEKGKTDDGKGSCSCHRDILRIFFW